MGYCIGEREKVLSSKTSTGVVLPQVGLFEDTGDEYLVRRRSRRSRFGNGSNGGRVGPAVRVVGWIPFVLKIPRGLE